MYRAMTPPPLAELYKYNVDVPNQAEGVWQPLYDYQTYPTAGTTEMSFFAVPRGQSSKTYADTNMEIAGSMPSPVIQHVIGIMVCLWPATAAASFGAGAAAKNHQEVCDILEAGYLEFTVGQKLITRDAPLMVFPPDFRLAGSAAFADVSTAAADKQSRVDYATSAGRVYEISPVNLIPNQNFEVKLRWGTAVAATANGRIGVRLLGYQLRRS